MGGLSRRYVKLQEMRDAGKNPVIVDAGDLFFSTKKLTEDVIESEKHRAKAILTGYSKIGCDAINIGHYELLGGRSFIKEMNDEFNIPFISANLRDPATNELVYAPNVLVKRGELTIGITGVTNKLPDTSKSFIIDDYIETGKKQIKELKSKADIIVILVNSDRQTHELLPSEFVDADFIVTSGSTNMTRSNTEQREGGPNLYSCGKQGKYLFVLDGELNNNKEPFINVSSYESKIKSINKRFERLQKKDPEKPLEEIYQNQTNVLKLIEQYRGELEDAKEIVESATNTLTFQTIGLSRKVQDDTELLAFVNETLETCNSLKPKKANQPINNKSKTIKSKLNDSHAGHNH